MMSVTGLIESGFLAQKEDVARVVCLSFNRFSFKSLPLPSVLFSEGDVVLGHLRV